MVSASNVLCVVILFAFLQLISGFSPPRYYFCNLDIRDLFPPKFTLCAVLDVENGMETWSRNVSPYEISRGHRRG